MSEYVLRPYQTEAIGDIWKSWRKGIWRQLLVLPTAAGKTVVFTHLLQHKPMQKWLGLYKESDRKVLVMAHREELLDQAAQKFASVGLRADIEQGSQKASKRADVVVGSVQSLANRLGKFDPDQFRLIIVDEAHHAVASSYLNVLSHFKCIPSIYNVSDKERLRLLRQRVLLNEWDYKTPTTDRLLLGVTATPNRFDAIGLEAVFQRIVYSKNIVDLIRDKWLSKIRAIRVDTKFSIDKVKTTKGDFVTKDLDEAINIEGRNKMIVEAYRSYGEGRPSVVFCNTVDHAQRVAAAFRAFGYRAAAVYGDMPKPERAKTLEDFNRGKLDVLTNALVLTEGWDAPRVQCIIHARPTKSEGLFIQMTGRGLRLFKGKRDCLIIDLVDASSHHSVVTTPCLLGLPATFNPEGRDLVEVLDEIEDLKKKTHIDTSHAQSLVQVQQQAKDVNLTALRDALPMTTSLRWLPMKEKYHLPFMRALEFSGLQRMILTVERRGRKWVCAVTTPSPEKIIAVRNTAIKALQAGEAWIKKQDVAVFQRMTRTHPYRARKLNNQLRAWLEKELKSPALPKGINFGEAVALASIHYYQREGKFPFVTYVS